MNNKNNKKIIFSILAFVVIGFAVFTAQVAFADLNVNYPSIPTPGGIIDLNDEVNEGRITMSAVIIFVYSAALWVAGILAFLALVFAGFAYIVSGANPGQRARAMNRFKNVLWGLGILLVSSVILNIINPQIVTIKDPKGLNVDPGNEQFLGFNFSFEKPELIDLIELCNSFETATDRVDLTNVPSCEWSPAVVESERTEWCGACTQNYGADTPCEQFISDPNTIVCGGEYEEPPPEDRPGGSEELDTQCENSATNTTVRINSDASPACEFKDYDPLNPGGPADNDVIAWGNKCESLGGTFDGSYYPDACSIDESQPTIFSCWLPDSQCVSS